MPQIKRQSLQQFSERYFKARFGQISPLLHNLKKVFAVLFWYLANFNWAIGQIFIALNSQIFRTIIWPSGHTGYSPNKVYSIGPCSTYSSPRLPQWSGSRARGRWSPRSSEHRWPEHGQRQAVWRPNLADGGPPEPGFGPWHPLGRNPVGHQEGRRLGA